MTRKTAADSRQWIEAEMLGGGPVDPGKLQELVAKVQATAGEADDTSREERAEEARRLVDSMRETVGKMFGQPG